MDDGDIYINQNEIDEEIEVNEEVCDELEDEHIEYNNDEEIADEEMIDNSILTFSNHKNAVLCCSISNNGSFAVSGDQNDMAYVWDFATGNVKFECNGHKDSVVCAGFSQKDNYIATGDMSGLIEIWNENGDKITQFEVDEINWMRWHPCINNVLLAGTKEGTAWMWQLDVKGDSNCKTFQGFGSSNTIGIYLNDGKRSVMGYEDGSIRIWDLKSTSVISSITGFNAHKDNVTSLDCTKDDALIGSGSVDCTAKIINCQSNKVLSTFKCGESVSQQDENDSVESVSFCSSLPLFATGTVNGAIEIWDITNHTRRHLVQQTSGISKLLWSSNSNHLLLTAGLDGISRIYDGRSGQLYDTKCGHSDQILDFCVSQFRILTASEDNTCRVFSL